MKILAIETSCDETAAAVVAGTRVLSNSIYSQIAIHKKWGGVVPNLAKRAHQERIADIVDTALSRARTTLGDVDALAVTYGPGLAPSLEVGIKYAKALAREHSLPLIPVNHMEGHIYSVFAQNSNGNPKRDFLFPLLALLVSGGHTQLVLVRGHCSYKILGETLDDAAGEALDKAGKMLGLGYPGGPAIERLAQNGDPTYHRFPRPLATSETLEFSFSGLKTSLFYYLKKIDQQERLDNIENIAASFQEAVFETIEKKLSKALSQTNTKAVVVGGGVVANKLFRAKMRRVAKEHGKPSLFPPKQNLYGDNAAMIGVAASFKAEARIFVEDLTSFDRKPRLRLGEE